MAHSIDTSLFPYPPVVPPGEDDLPYDDGEPMETQRHRFQGLLLLETLESHWQGRQDFFAGGDMFVYFSETQIRKNTFRGPDFFVVLGTTHRERKSWVSWGEDGKLPNVVVEIVSPTTETIDRGEKRRIYEQIWKTGEYYLYDVFSTQLDGLALSHHGYEAMEAGPDGRLAAHQLGLRLGHWTGTYRNVEATWIRWFTPEGELLPSDEERAEAEKRNAEAEKRNAEAEKRNAEAEKRNAEAEKRNAEAEKRKAEAERRGREAAEAQAAALGARVAELERQLASKS